MFPSDESARKAVVAIAEQFNPPAVPGGMAAPLLMDGRGDAQARAQALRGRGMTVAEIAKCLETPETTVRRWLRWAREAQTQQGCSKTRLTP
jgi:hypothetical protein